MRLGDEFTVSVEGREQRYHIVSIAPFGSDLSVEGASVRSLIDEFLAANMVRLYNTSPSLRRKIERNFAAVDRSYDWLMRSQRRARRTRVVGMLNRVLREGGKQ